MNSKEKIDELIYLQENYIATLSDIEDMDLTPGEKNQVSRSIGELVIHGSITSEAIK